MLFVETTKFFADYFTFILKILQVPGLFEGVCGLLCVLCIIGLPSWYKFPVDFQGVTVVFAKGILSACNTWPFIGQKVAFCNVKGHLSYFVLFSVVFHVLYRCRAAGGGRGAGCRYLVISTIALRLYDGGTSVSTPPAASVVMFSFFTPIFTSSPATRSALLRDSS